MCSKYIVYLESKCAFQILFICLFIYLFILLFRAGPEAYVSSQARVQIGAVAASLYHSHSNVGSKLHL